MVWRLCPAGGGAVRMVSMQPSHRALGTGMWQGQKGEQVGHPERPILHSVEGAIAVLFLATLNLLATHAALLWSPTFPLRTPTSSCGQLPSMVQSWPVHPDAATAYLEFPAPFLTTLLCPLTLARCPILTAPRGRVPQRGSKRARHRSAVPAGGSAGGVRTRHAHAPPSQR